jgi:cyclase
MLTRRVVPCLDVRDGRVVKGVRFKSLRDAGLPVELASQYEADGADEIVILDVSATLEERSNAVETVRAVRDAIAIPLTVGGGVRSEADARVLLDAGADKVALNTAAQRDPAVLTALATRYGSQCVVLSIDAKATDGEWRVVVRAGTSDTPVAALDWAREGEQRGSGEILLTSVDRDGTQSGYDLALVEAVAASVGIPVVASGGARTAVDMTKAFEAGADAVLAASILHDGLTSVRQLKTELRAAGIEVRL